MVRLSAVGNGHLYPLPQVNISGSYVCLMLSQTHGHSDTGRIMSKKYSSDITGNRNRDLPICSVGPQPTELPRSLKLEDTNQTDYDM